MTVEIQTTGKMSERALYIKRPEDDEVYRLLRNGEYCNVLTSRQMGKSSLSVRLRRRLQDTEGGRTRVVSTSLEGTGGSAAIPFTSWYHAVLSGLALDQDKTTAAFEAWWAKRPRLVSADETSDDANRVGTGAQETVVQRVQAFLREFILRKGTTEKAQSPVVIFFDEVDITRNRGYTDELFLALRAMYNERADDDELRLLTVCLLGVLSPDELIKTRSSTPYNVGVTVRLSDFSRATCKLDELDAFLDQVGLPGRQTVDEVLKWTGGQPFLTMTLCNQLVNDQKQSKNARSVKALVDAEIRNPTAFAVHFGRIQQIISERIAADSKMRSLYLKVLRGGRVRGLGHKDEEALLLAGLVWREADGRLRARNKIYQLAFGKSWVDRVLPAAPIPHGVRIALLLLTIALVAGAAALWKARRESRDNAEREQRWLSLAGSLVNAKTDSEAAKAWKAVLNAGLATDARLREVAEQRWKDRTKKLTELSDTLFAAGCEEEAWTVDAFLTARGTSPSAQVTRTVRAEQRRTQQVLWLRSGATASGAVAVDRCKARRETKCDRLTATSRGIFASCTGEVFAVSAETKAERVARSADRAVPFGATSRVFASYSGDSLVLNEVGGRELKVRVCPGKDGQVIDVNADELYGKFVVSFACLDGRYGWTNVDDLNRWLNGVAAGRSLGWQHGYGASALGWLADGPLIGRGRTLEAQGTTLGVEGTVTALSRGKLGASFAAYATEEPTSLRMIQRDQRRLVPRGGPSDAVCDHCVIRAVASDQHGHLAALGVELDDKGAVSATQLFIGQAARVERLELGTEQPFDVAVVEWRGQALVALPLLGRIRLLSFGTVAQGSWVETQQRLGLTVLDADPPQVEPLAGAANAIATSYSDCVSGGTPSVTP